MKKQAFELPVDEEGRIHCHDCSGWPIEEGAAFVILMIHGEQSLCAICEVCHLKRLQERAMRVNSTSGPKYQIHIPEININPRRSPQDYPKRRPGDYPGKPRRNPGGPRA